MDGRRLERAVLGPIMLRPALLAAVDLSADEFPAGLMRKAFEAMSSIYEDLKPAEIDPEILLSRLGSNGNGTAAFVGSLMNELVRVEPELFKARVLEMRRRRIRLRILGDIEKALKAEEQSGEIDVVAFDAARGRLRELDALEAMGEEVDPILGNLADVEPEPVLWLWEPYFPAGKLIGLGGDPDLGKSWFALQIAACLSRGLIWPDGGKNTTIGSTVYLSGEDDPADTLRPRLDSLGGDPKKVFFLNRDGLDLTSQEMIDALEAEIKKIPDCRLLVLDPAFDFTGKTNPNAVEQARSFLGPIKALAKRLSIAVLLIIHAKKGQVDKAIDWVGGSKSGWAGKFRALFGIEKTNEDPTRRIFFKIKANLSPIEPPKIAFRIVTGRLEFEAAPAAIEVSELLRHDHSDDGLQITEAVKFLRSILADGPMDPPEVYRQAIAAGFARRTIERAKQRAGVESVKDGLRWRWHLVKVGGLHSVKGEIAGRWS